MTLHFYSAKAYEFVRKTFNFALPHQANIPKWYAKIPAEPEFTKPAFDAVRENCNSQSEGGESGVLFNAG